MKLPHNIVKIQRGRYIGHAPDGEWIISRSTSSFGNWVAYHISSQRAPTLYAMTLREMSERLRAGESK